MTRQATTRRSMLRNATLSGLALATAPVTFANTNRPRFRSPNERPVIGCIGTGDRWKAVGLQALQFADCAAVCDVDAGHVNEAQEIARNSQNQSGRERAVDSYEDYRGLLDRSDIDVVTIVTPDHWHAKIAIDAMRAGKDVYCEKPLTLTIHEGQQVRQVLEETGRVFQVGTQQRSEMELKFLTAVAIVREGRIGTLRTVTTAIGGAPNSGPIPVAEVPNGLNWDLWLGQAPFTEYRFREGGRFGSSRCHYEFRWWYEYSGGKMTDWGAHHVDIATWALDAGSTGPIRIEPVMAEHPVELKNGMPTDESQYNTATGFHVRATYANGAILHIRDNAEDLGFENGILLEGSDGRIFVNRGKLSGLAVENLVDQPLREDTFLSLYKGKQPGDHMRNFFECVFDRTEPVSDVASHHRALTTCHLANIAIRLNRRLAWDPVAEQITGDPEAALWQSREQRKGYEIRV